jgi:hypothetical protein
MPLQKASAPFDYKLWNQLAREPDLMKNGPVFRHSARMVEA